ncbi:MAG: hypothetical protein SH857_14235 [Chitinophagales bacterium]|nr:hypothetical protein [Chitinophagales bacterium]
MLASRVTLIGDAVSLLADASSLLALLLRLRRDASSLFALLFRLRGYVSGLLANASSRVVLSFSLITCASRLSETTLKPSFKTSVQEGNLS